MTKTLAAKVIEGLHLQGWRVLGHGGTWAGAMRPLEAYVSRRVKRAVLAEREACAQRLEAIGCDHCASNIRARGEPQDTDNPSF